jgi:hypothetical protein
MSRLESLVVSSASRLGIDEMALLSIAIAVVLAGTAGLLFGAGLVR